MEQSDCWMRQKAVAAYLGLSRFTLARIIKSDPSFPRFVELSPGVRVVRRSAIAAWLRTKEVETAARAPYATTRTRIN